MKLLRRVVGAIVLILATVGIVCCVAGIVGVWNLRADVARKVEVLDARVEVGMKRVSAAIHSVQLALQKARDDVQRVSKASVDLGAEPERKRFIGGVLRMLIHQELGPKINDLGGRLATFSDTAVAVVAMLESFQEVPLDQGNGINPDKLKRVTDHAAQLSAALQKLQAMVGEGDGEFAPQEVVAAANEVNLILQRCEETVNYWESELDAARQEVARLKARIPVWLTWAAVAVTVLLAWGVVSQMSLVAHAWKWFRGT
jgi:hypothetical protein